MLGLVVVSGARNATAGVTFQALTPGRYALTQAGVIAHYLRLAIWPAGLSLDYDDWPIARTAVDLWPQLVGIGLLVAGTLWGLARQSWLGLAGAWFFLILAPTSSLVPIVSEIAAERRMYLPLVAVVAIGVVAVDWLLRRATTAGGRPGKIAGLAPDTQAEACGYLGRVSVVVLLGISLGLGWGAWRRRAASSSTLPNMSCSNPGPMGMTSVCR